MGPHEQQWERKLSSEDPCQHCSEILRLEKKDGLLLDSAEPRTPGPSPSETPEPPANDLQRAPAQGSMHTEAGSETLLPENGTVTGEYTLYDILAFLGFLYLRTWSKITAFLQTGENLR